LKSKDIVNKAGVILLFEIPKHLNPIMAPIGKILKDDSNNGIEDEWTKVIFHIY
jgi:hypothetical protein